MAKAYSDDLRRKVLEQYEQGGGTFEDVAERFCVSVSWAKKISASHIRTGKMERPRGGKPGRKSKVTLEINEFLRASVAAQSDLTLVELKSAVHDEKQVDLSIGWLWESLRRLGLSFKKNSTRH